MAEFIGRPNFGPASGLWQEAIKMAAQQSNPMANAVNTGIDRMDKGISMLFQQAQQEAARKATAEQSTIESDRAANRAAASGLMDLNLRGQVSPMTVVNPNQPYSALPAATQNLMTSAQPSPVMTKPLEYKLPEGGLMSASDYYKALGATPPAGSEKIALTGPRKEKMDMVEVTPEVRATFSKLKMPLAANTKEVHKSLFEHALSIANPKEAQVKAPTGFRYASGGELEAIPGGPADIKAQEKAEIKEKAMQMVKDHAIETIETVKKAIAATGVTTAGLGALSKDIYGTPAKTLSGYIDTLKAKLSFEQLQQMRAQSKTGGALGNVSDNELRLLSSAVASLDQGQNQEILKQNLAKVMQQAEKVLSRIQSNEPEKKNGNKNTEYLKSLGF